MTTPIIISWFSPLIPPDPLPAIKCDQIVQVVGGRDEFASYLGSLLSGGYVKSFRLGEGGYRQSPLTSNEKVNIGNGGTAYSNTGPIAGNAASFSFLPLVPKSITVAGGTNTATDMFGDGNLYDLATGTLIGTINYKTGSWSLVFLSGVAGGVDILASYRTRGQVQNRGEDLASGNGSSGPYTGTTTFAPIVPGSLLITDVLSQFVVDNGDGTLGGDGSGTIDYETGVYAVTFGSAVDVGWFVRASYHAYRIPLAPSEGKTALESEQDASLYTFSKDFVAGDLVFQGVGTGRVRVTLNVLASEGNDDGSGNSPYYYEGGLFSVNGVLLAYFTFPGVKKTASGAFSKVFDLAM